MGDFICAVILSLQVPEAARVSVSRQLVDLVWRFLNPGTSSLAPDSTTTLPPMLLTRSPGEGDSGAVDTAIGTAFASIIGDPIQIFYPSPTRDEGGSSLTQISFNPTRLPPSLSGDVNSWRNSVPSLLRSSTRNILARFHQGFTYLPLFHAESLTWRGASVHNLLPGVDNDSGPLVHHRAPNGPWRRLSSGTPVDVASETPCASPPEGNFLQDHNGNAGDSSLPPGGSTSTYIEAPTTEAEWVTFERELSHQGARDRLSTVEPSCTQLEEDPNEHERDELLHTSSPPEEPSTGTQLEEWPSDQEQEGRRELESHLSTGSQRTLLDETDLDRELSESNSSQSDVTANYDSEAESPGTLEEADHASLEEHTDGSVTLEASVANTICAPFAVAWTKSIFSAAESVSSEWSSGVETSRVQTLLVGPASDTPPHLASHLSEECVDSRNAPAGPSVLSVTRRRNDASAGSDLWVVMPSRGQLDTGRSHYCNSPRLP